MVHLLQISCGILSLFLCCVINAFSPSSQVQSSVNDRPNIILILADDQGYSDLSCYGHPILETPHIDQLAAEGIKFTNCYAAAPNCSPARAGLLTGRVPSRTGIYDWVPSGGPMHLPVTEITIATLLQKAGYATCQVGKWHLSKWVNSSKNPKMQRPLPDDHGFDHWFGVDNNAKPNHHNPINYFRNGVPLGKLEGYACHLVVEEGIKWIDSLKKNKPFFLYVPFNEPHTPLGSPPELKKYYQSKTKDVKKAEYYANVANIDLAVGKLMRALDDRGLRDNTLVIYSSDNGPARGDNGVYKGVTLRGRKSSLYEGGIREPGIVRWPKVIAKGQTITNPVHAVDVLPTLCEVVGILPPQDRILDGCSWLPLLKNQKFQRGKPLFWYFYKSSPCAVLRSGDWVMTADPKKENKFRSKSHMFDKDDLHYIKNTELGQFALYNIEKDIAQKNDVSSENPKLFEKLKNQIIKMHTSVVSEGPDWPSLLSDKEMLIRK